MMMTMTMTMMVVMKMIDDDDLAGVRREEFEVVPYA